MQRHLRGSVRDWPLLVLAFAVIVPLYWPSLRFDLFQDDYYLLRPWPPEHLVGVLTGPWFDPDTADSYRPVAIYLYKAMFWTFGLNTRALHVLPLITMSLLAWLTGVFVRRETGSTRLASLATIIYAVHPSTVAAIGPWISNQYQGVVSGMLLLSLLWWQECRNRRWPFWLPLTVPVLVGGFAKETGLMIPLIIAAVHKARLSWLERQSRGWTMALVGVAVFASLIAWRSTALGAVAIPPAQNIYMLVLRFLQAPWAVLAEPVNAVGFTEKWVFAACSLGLVTAAGVTVLTRRPRPAASLALTGIIVVMAAAVPTSLVFSRDRLTPHGVGAVLILAGGAAAIVDALRGLKRRRAVVLAVVGAGASLALATSIGVSRTAMSRFDPCNTATVDYPDALLEEVRRPPPEMLEWLRNRPHPCTAETHVPFFRATSHITWGVAERQLAPGTSWHEWIRPRVVALLDHRATAVVVTVRHRSASATRTFEVWIEPGVGPAVDLHLTTPEWTSVTIPLASNWHTWVRQMHRIDMFTSIDAVPGLEMRPLDVVY